MGLGKTIQVISFLSALMRKSGTPSDKERRRNRVSQLQDGVEWRRGRKLPPPDDKWPTALIVTPSSVVNVWTREFEKVIGYRCDLTDADVCTKSGATSRLMHTSATKVSESAS
jgi:SNF2 family DNA or RNA helicase